MIWLIIILGIIIDQLTKLLVVANLPFNSTVSVLGDFFGLRYIHNQGAAWSLLEEHPMLLVVLSLVILIVVIVLLYKTPKEQKLLRAGFALVIAGALGNLIDRIRLGYVVDFLRLPHWPIFNIADCLLVVGVILICIVLLFGKTDQTKTKQR